MFGRELDYGEFLELVGSNVDGGGKIQVCLWVDVGRFLCFCLCVSMWVSHVYVYVGVDDKIL